MNKMQSLTITFSYRLLPILHKSVKPKLLNHVKGLFGVKIFQCHQLNLGIFQFVVDLQLVPNEGLKRNGQRIVVDVLSFERLRCRL
jgi:hypothetical protein